MEELKNERLANLNSQLSKMGLSADFLKKEIGKNYTVGDAMLKGERSPLVQIKLNTPEYSANINGKIRVTYENMNDAKAKISIIGIQKELQIPKNIQDFKLTDDQAKNLKIKGHLGEVAKIHGKDTYISVDKDTNTLVTASAAKINIPTKILDKELTQADQNTLKAGKTITIENMTNKRGEKFSAEISVDAGKKGLEFKAVHPKAVAKTESLKADALVENVQNATKPKTSLKSTPKLETIEKAVSKKSQTINSLVDLAASKPQKIGQRL